MKRIVLGGICLFLLSCFSELIFAQTVVGLDSVRLTRVDGIINEAIDKEDIPGAVLLVAREGRIAYLKAYGQCQLEPDHRAMHEDMMFDMASVTKPIATATSIMILAERGQLRLTDRVSDYVPGFSRYVQTDSTLAPEARIWHLLTHTSGLLPYTDADEAADSLGRPADRKALVSYIGRLPKQSAPGKDYRYSCLGYITLGYIVQAVTGQSLDIFSRHAIFEPLGMTHTLFTPPDSLLDRCVPTEVIDGDPLIGIVHDPLARLQGGVSGNAGLYSTAHDLLRYATMMLNGGVYQGVRLFSPVTVDRMTRITETQADAHRGYGWVVKKGQSWVGGDLFPDGGFGHTGYTGTSIWIDPSTETVTILLTNRVHPVDDGSVSWLRSAVANIVASAILDL